MGCILYGCATCTWTWMHPKYSATLSTILRFKRFHYRVCLINTSCTLIRLELEAEQKTSWANRIVSKPSSTHKPWSNTRMFYACFVHIGSTRMKRWMFCRVDVELQLRSRHLTYLLRSARRASNGDLCVNIITMMIMILRRVQDAKPLPLPSFIM